MSATTSKDETFTRIRSEVSRDLRPVKPLSSGWVRALFLLPYALLTLAVFLFGVGLRSDARALGPAILWGLLILQLLFAYLILFVALRHGVPGNAVSPKMWLGLPLLVLSLQVGVALLTYQYSPLEPPPDRVEQYGLICLGTMSFLGLVPLAVVVWLLSRGFPLQPRVAGLLTGFGSGLVAEALYRTHCPYSNMSHILVWHVGAVLMLGLVGLCCGLYWESRRLRRWERQRHS
jgi:hypothetical protein